MARFFVSSTRMSACLQLVTGFAHPGVYCPHHNEWRAFTPRRQLFHTQQPLALTGVRDGYRYRRPKVFVSLAQVGESSFRPLPLPSNAMMIRLKMFRTFPRRSAF